MRRERERRSFSPHKAELSFRPGTPHGLFCIYGRRPVLEAMRLGVVRSIELARSAHGQVVQELMHAADEQNIPLVRVEEFDEHEDVVAQGVRAFASPPQVRTDLRPFIEQLPQVPAPLLLMLDGVTDPHNFGAILRTAEGAGVDAVIVRERRQAPITETVVKASAGAAYFTPVFQVVNLSQTVRLLKEAGFWAVAAVGEEASRNYWEYDWARPTLLVFGAEGSGVSPLLRRDADERVAIPMVGRIESLNVSVAAGVILFEALKRRAG